MRRLRPGAVVAVGATAAMAAVMLGSAQASAATESSANRLVKVERLTPTTSFANMPIDPVQLALLQQLAGLDLSGLSNP
ncbi:hypothetical protein [Streptomyces sp. NPDC058698]|uniref:hypothetical protein n=1 Tax=Streptomyces sp. NPDC058698 TaxID=3346606 RepID=UPI0036665CEC